MSEALPLLFIVRHGNTTLNEEGVYRGDTNPPLNAEGFRDANELAFYFDETELGFIVSSDKLRARQTAETIHRGHDCAYQITEGLRPWNIGDFGGKPKTKENRELLEYFVQNPDISTPNGESLTEFRGRIRPRLMKAVELSHEALHPGMLVVHSSVIHEVGETFGTHHEDAHVRPGGVAVIFLRDGQLGVEPIFREDSRATTQNVLGTTSRTNTIS